jgi:ankyrin repeat protein
LLCALENGSIDVAKLLIAKGADVNAQNDNGEIPLLLAVSGTQVNVARLRIFLPGESYLYPRFNSLSDAEGIAKYSAICEDYRDIVKRLLACGAKANVKDKEGDNPLHYATRIGETEITELLIQHGAAVNEKDSFGLTPLHYAARGHKNMAELLLTNGADINAEAPDGDTPLHDASLRGHLDIVDLLVNSGANINIRNSRGRTPIEDAARREHLDIVEMLRRHGANEHKIKR